MRCWLAGRIYLTGWQIRWLAHGEIDRPPNDLPNLSKIDGPKWPKQRVSPQTNFRASDEEAEASQLQNDFATKPATQSVFSCCCLTPLLQHRRTAERKKQENHLYKRWSWEKRLWFASCVLVFVAVFCVWLAILAQNLENKISSTKGKRINITKKNRKNIREALRLAMS